MVKNRILLTLNAALGCIFCYSATFLSKGSWLALFICVAITVYMGVFLWVNTRDIQ